MNVPDAFHLPGFSGRASTRAIEGTSLVVPELDAADVRRQVARLRNAAAALRKQSLDARAQRVAAACAGLRQHGAGRWRDALAASAGLSAPGLDAAWEASLAPLSLEAIRAALGAESLDDDALATHDAHGPHLFLHVLAGNVLAPTMQMLTRGWLLGAAQWLRPAAREPLFAACILSELDALDPGLAACTAVLWWAHGSRTEAAVLGCSDTVTIQGDAASVLALQRRVEEIRPQATFVGYGPRWSAALLSEAAQTAENARALAYDVALFDQQGCLSPTVAFVERSAHTPVWCESLATALAELETRLPRGSLSAEARASLRHWHETTRLQRVLGSVDAMWEDSILWGVALLSERAHDDIGTALESPLDRHLIVVPFDRVERLCAALTPQLERLQGLAVALDGWDRTARRGALARFNPSHVADLGTLQLPPPKWRQDHKPPFSTLLARNEPT